MEYEGGSQCVYDFYSNISLFELFFVKVCDFVNRCQRGFVEGMVNFFVFFSRFCFDWLYCFMLVSVWVLYFFL